MAPHRRPSTPAICWSPLVSLGSSRQRRDVPARPLRLLRRRNTCCMARARRNHSKGERERGAERPGAGEGVGEFVSSCGAERAEHKAGKARAVAVAAGLFYGILLRASAALGHSVHAELPSPSRGRARSVPLASEGFLSPLSWRVGGVGGDCSIQVVRLMAAPSPAQHGGGGGYGGR